MRRSESNKSGLKCEEANYGLRGTKKGNGRAREIWLERESNASRNDVDINETSRIILIPFYSLAKQPECSCWHVPKFMTIAVLGEDNKFGD